MEYIIPYISYNCIFKNTRHIIYDTLVTRHNLFYTTFDILLDLRETILHTIPSTFVELYIIIFDIYKTPE